MYILGHSVNWKPMYNFLLVNNTNLAPIGQILASDKGSLHFNAYGSDSPANLRVNFTSQETRMIVLPDVENRCNNVNNRTPECEARTDRWTDLFWLLQR